jgi:hypothetical protein
MGIPLLRSHTISQLISPSSLESVLNHSITVDFDRCMRDPSGQKLRLEVTLANSNITVPLLIECFPPRARLKGTVKKVLPSSATTVEVLACESQVVAADFLTDASVEASGNNRTWSSTTYEVIPYLPTLPPNTTFTNQTAPTRRRIRRLAGEETQPRRELSQSNFITNPDSIYEDPVEYCKFLETDGTVANIPPQPNSNNYIPEGSFKVSAWDERTACAAASTRLFNDLYVDVSRSLEVPIQLKGGDISRSIRSDTTIATMSEFNLWLLEQRVAPNRNVLKDQHRINLVRKRNTNYPNELLVGNANADSHIMKRGYPANWKYHCPTPSVYDPASQELYYGQSRVTSGSVCELSPVHLNYVAKKDIDKNITGVPAPVTSTCLPKGLSPALQASILTPACIRLSTIEFYGGLNDCYNGECQTPYAQLVAGACVASGHTLEDLTYQLRKARSGVFSWSRTLNPPLDAELGLDTMYDSEGDHSDGSISPGECPCISQQNIGRSVCPINWFEALSFAKSPFQPPVTIPQFFQLGAHVEVGGYFHVLLIDEMPSHQIPSPR